MDQAYIVHFVDPVRYLSKNVADRGFWEPGPILLLVCPLHAVV